MHALRLFELNTTALIMKNSEQRDERQIHCWPSLGKDELALHFRLILLIRWLTIGVCLTSSLSRSHG